MILLLLLSIEEDSFIPKPGHPEWKVSPDAVYKIMEKDWIFGITDVPGGFLHINLPHFEVPYVMANRRRLNGEASFHLPLMRAYALASGSWDSLISKGLFEVVKPAKNFSYVFNTGYLINNGITPTGSFTGLFTLERIIYGFTAGYRHLPFGGLILQFPGLRLTFGKNIAGITIYRREWFLRGIYRYSLPPFVNQWFSPCEYRYRAATTIDGFFYGIYMRTDITDGDYLFYVRRKFLKIYYDNRTKITGINGTIGFNYWRMKLYLYFNLEGMEITISRKFRGEMGLFLKPLHWIFPSVGFILSMDGERRFVIGAGME